MKSRFSDPNYLRSDQYKNAANLTARAQLHARFSVNKLGWHRWLFEQLDLPETARLLEIGCGPAWLWAENAERIPGGWQITLSDFSSGMIEEAQAKLKMVPRVFTFDVIDAQSIPYPEATFDAVIANHMLYHVPDRVKAISEFWRVLKPGGQLYAATNGEGHLRELDELTARFTSASLWEGFSIAGTFTLENGAAQLTDQFSSVTMKRYADGLIVTEVEPLMAYALSGRGKEILTGDQIEAFARFIEQEISKTGAIHISKDAGLFVARK
ncbi:MAG: methyltransferase domain-containing protein [Chloroflexi bacterium]|nr:methyltransferase domain-containing protein [Chloroflexota bacterium]